MFCACLIEDRQRSIEVALSRLYVTFVALEKQCVTYSEYLFVALGIRHAVLLRRFTGMLISP